MSSFWFWVVFDVLMLASDIVWWAVAVRLTKRRLWRVAVSVFMAGQTAAYFFLLAGFDGWLNHAPKVVVVAVVIWHRLGLLCAAPIVLVFGIVRLRAWLVRRKRSVATQASTRSETRREFIGACAALAPTLFTIGFTGVGLAQANCFRVRRLTLSMPALPRALDGMTIAHVSDIHVGRWTCGRVLRDIVNTTNSLRADLVMVTGDLIHYELADLSEAIALVKAMEARYGLWMIEGNHDLFDDGEEFERRVKAAGLPLLLDESAMANVRGHPVQCFGLRWLLGNDRERDRIMALQMRYLMKQRQPDAFPILLAHHPHAFDIAAKAALPLTLSGHTHGGQWMLDSQRGVGSVLFRYWSGLYVQRTSQMVVSNGVGNVFPVRINAPAEIVHLTLRSAENDG